MDKERAVSRSMGAPAIVPSAKDKTTVFTEYPAVKSVSQTPSPPAEQPPSVGSGTRRAPRPAGV